MTCDVADIAYFEFYDNRQSADIPYVSASGKNYECIYYSYSPKGMELTEENTKGRQAGTVYFSKKMAVLLRRWLKFKDRYCESEYLFPKHDGTMINLSSFETNFRKYLKNAGITKDISPHALRNNFAKRCLMAGLDIYTLSRILGHSSVTVTEKAYLDLTDEDIRMRYQHFSPIEKIM